MRRSSFEYIIPASLALVLTLVLIRYVPLLSTRYLLKLEHTEQTRPDYYKLFHDMDGDGTSEIVELFYNTAENLAVKVRYLNETTINQFNLPGRTTKTGALLALHDINSDGITDIFVCSEKNDSLYLTVIDDVFSHPTTTRRYSLDAINRYNDNGDYAFIPGGVADLNGDGGLEYIFAINGGHSLQPRRVYAIDYLNDSLMRSPISGAAIHRLGLFDMDGDGNQEVLVSTTSTENFSTEFPYMDTTAWLMILDSQLNFLLPPFAMCEHLSFADLLPFIYEGSVYLLSEQRYLEGDQMFYLLTLYDQSYMALSERKMLRRRSDHIKLLREPGSTDLNGLKLVKNQTLYSLDTALSFIDSVRKDIPPGFENPDCRIDVNGDEDLEYVYPFNQHMVVARSDLKYSASADISWAAWSRRNLISIVQNGTEPSKLFIHLETEGNYLTYGPNRWFKYRILLYPVIFLALFGLLYQLLGLQNRLIRRAYEKDRLISKLQLQSIKQQLDPHFTYNALNAVGSLIYKGEKDLAYQYLKGLTDLLRMVSGDASDVTWTLKDELNFVKKFLDIERLRFREKFEYKMDVQDEMEDMKVPKLSILNFVENAIKHGLRHRVTGRKLEISAVAFGGGLKIGIKDNGIGRAAAHQFQDEDSGKGIKMMKRYFKQFNEASGRKAHFEISDLYVHENEPAGTLVEIFIT